MVTHATNFNNQEFGVRGWYTIVVGANIQSMFVHSLDRKGL